MQIMIDTSLNSLLLDRQLGTLKNFRGRISSYCPSGMVFRRFYAFGLELFKNTGPLF